MNRVAWVTDIHLNCVSNKGLVAFARSILDHNPDSVLIGGDIGEADSIVEYLQELECHLALPVFFVLGNHDFYKGSIHQVRTHVSRLCRDSSRLSYLSEVGVVSLTPTVALVGHDSWADGRLGDYEQSEVLLTDHFAIQDFNLMLSQTESAMILRQSRTEIDAAYLAGPEAKEYRLTVMQSLAEEAASHFRKYLPIAFESHQHVIVLTHVPPFKQACWYGGKVSDDDWLPHFSCKAVGDILLETMKVRPKQKLTVLCGHTHGSGETEILDNLIVYTGGATYGHPEIQRVFEFE